MAAQDPEEAQLNATYAANMALSRLSPLQRKQRMKPAWAATLRKLEDEIDPERTLTEKDRAARVESLRRARMAELAKLAVQARRAKRNTQVGAA